MARTLSQTVRVSGHEVSLTNLNKVLYPEAGFTKAQILSYYEQISPYLLPHLKNRVLTLKRFPEGVDQAFFYEKRCPVYRPDWIKTARMRRESRDETIDFCQIDNLAGIVWVVNLASLEFHTFLSTGDDFDRPTMMVFDLDPGEGRGFKDCCQVALRLRKLLKSLKLETFAKSSGGKGLHLYVPLNTKVTFEDTKTFSNQIALYLENEDPSFITATMSKAVRKKKIFIDWSQNDRHKTTVCVYSLRARERPTVSAPLAWKEVEAFSKAKPLRDFPIEAAMMPARMKKVGDLFEPVLKMKQKLPSLKGKL
jgi:bifunctional non-homologous end joining protein LigD